MREHVMVDYAQADAWKQRAKATAKAERLSRQAVKVALKAVKGGDIPGMNVLADDARKAINAAIEAAREAEQVWANTAAAVKIDLWA